MTARRWRLYRVFIRQKYRLRCAARRFGPLDAPSRCKFTNSHANFQTFRQLFHTRSRGFRRRWWHSGQGLTQIWQILAEVVGFYTISNDFFLRWQSGYGTTAIRGGVLTQIWQILAEVCEEANTNPPNPHESFGSMKQNQLLNLQKPRSGCFLDNTTLARNEG